MSTENDHAGNVPPPGPRIRRSNVHVVPTSERPGRRRLLIAALVLGALAAGAWFWRPDLHWSKPAPVVVCSLNDIAASERLCTAGDLHCCAETGKALISGVRITRDLTRGDALLRRACDGGNTSACVALGQLNERRHRMDVAAGFYDKACELKEFTSCGRLIWRIRLGAAFPEIEKLRQRLLDTCEMTSAACPYAGELLEHGLGGPKDDQHARSLYESSCDTGEAQGCEDEAHWKEGHAAGQEDIRALANRLEERCNTVPRACAVLADLGDRRPSASVRVDAMATLACHRQETSACLLAAKRVIEGFSAAKSTDAARTDIARLCADGDEHACDLFERLLSTGTTLPETPYAPALKDAWLRAAAEAKSHRMNQLATPFLTDPDRKGLAELLIGTSELMEGHLGAARMHMNAAGDVDPMAPVLRALIERREQHPVESWWHTAVAAWTHAGQPDLRDSALLGQEVLPLRWGPLRWQTVRDPADRFVVAASDALGGASFGTEGWPEPPAEELVQDALAAADDSRRTVRCLAWRVLSVRTIPGELGARAHERATSLFQQLQQAEPDNAFFPLQKLGAGDGWLSTEDLNDLTRYSEWPRYQSCAVGAITALSPTLRKFDPETWRDHAALAAVALMGNEQVINLRQRLKDTIASNSERAAIVGRIARGVGEHVSQGGTLLEAGIGLQLMSLAAEGDPQLQARVQELRQPFGEAMRYWLMDSPSQMTQWPLRELDDETLAALDSHEWEQFRDLSTFFHSLPGAH